MSTINFKVFETKPLKMLTTPYLGSTLLVGHSVEIPAQAEREGRQAADTLPGAPSSWGLQGGSLPLVRKAASGARDGGFMPLRQAWPHLPKASVHPPLKVRCMSLLLGTTLNFLCISYSIYPQAPSLGPGFPACPSTWGHLAKFSI